MGGEQRTLKTVSHAHNHGLHKGNRAQRTVASISSCFHRAVISRREFCIDLKVNRHYSVDGSPLLR
jgi:hypothetical protein